MLNRSLTWPNRLNRFLLVFFVLALMSMTAYARNPDLSFWMANVSESSSSEEAGEEDFAHEMAVVGPIIHAMWLTTKAGYQGYKVYYRRSADNGVTWEPKKLLFEKAGNELDRSKYYRRMAASGNNVIIAVNYTTGSPWHGVLAVISSTNGGSTFDAPRTLFTAADVHAVLDVFAAAEGSNITIGFRHQTNWNESNSYYLKVSTDNGTSFSDRTVYSVSSGGDAYWRVHDMQRKGNNIYVLYVNGHYSYSVDYSRVYIASSHDGGQTFNSTKVSFPSKSGQDIQGYTMQDTDYVPKIAAEGDSVSVIWNGSDENDIQSVFYCRSIDAGVTWESTQNLTTGTLPQGKEIKQGQETLAGKGTYVYALFVSTGANIYLRRSISGGTTFAGLQELTTTSNAGGNLGTNNGWWPVIGTDPSDATGATVYAMWTTPTYVYSRDGGATFTKPTVIIPYFSLGNWPFSAPRTRLSLGEDGKFHYTVISQFTSAELCGGICDPDIFYRGVTQSPLPISTDKALKIVTGRDLDRYDNMQVRATDWLNFSSRLTAEVWVKPAPGGETTGTTSASKPIFYKQSVGGSNLYDFAYSLLTHDRYGQRQARGEIRTADGTFGVNPYSHTEGLVPDGTWTHLAMTYDAAGGTDNLKLYMNGLLIATATATGNLATEDGLFFAGKYGIWEIDELRLWAVVRTQSEIASNMRIWLTGNETGLNAYYNFNGTTRDITRHGNDGILMYKEEFVPSGVVGINPLLLPSRGGWRATLGQ